MWVLRVLVAMCCVSGSVLGSSYLEDEFYRNLKEIYRNRLMEPLTTDLRTEVDVIIDNFYNLTDNGPRQRVKRAAPDDKKGKTEATICICLKTF